MLLIPTFSHLRVSQSYPQPPHRATPPTGESTTYIFRTGLVKVNTIPPYTQSLSLSRGPPRKAPTMALRFYYKRIQTILYIGV